MSLRYSVYNSNRGDRVTFLSNPLQYQFQYLNVHHLGELGSVEIDGKVIPRIK